MPTPELPGHGVPRAAAQNERGYLRRENRRARIQELGDRAHLLQDVYGLVTRKLEGTAGTVHGRLCELADEATPDSGGLLLKKRCHGMIKDLVDFENELFSLLAHRLQLSEEDMETIKTEWRLENIHAPARSAAENDDHAETDS